VAFRETERFGVESVSDGLKTFSAMVERSDPGGQMPSIISLLRQQSRPLFSTARGVDDWKEVVLLEC
jgi:hypothetical protein